ncbi:MAG: hypothetical protein A2020_07025 [Lentisphaerae bacterium GWF2_45_14]|nr:MAG: hypothetical protein A2020_07025 [Lentisphaerae bacterium GWF2_45_14]
MKMRRSLLLGTWFLLILNLILATGTVALLNRMTPAIAKIISENDKSLASCEGMLAELAIMNNRKLEDTDKKRFYDAIQRAENNITEKGEPAILAEIKKYSKSALEGDVNAIDKEIKSIMKLALLNREAMGKADKNARRLGTTGAWGAVFIACISFISGLLFIRYLNLLLLLPLGELYSVLKAHKKGDSLRRCARSGNSSYFYFIYDEINALLDEQNHKR